MANWIWWLSAGMLSALGGIVALANPFAATLAIELLIGAIFMVTGLLTLISVFGAQGFSGRIIAALVGIGLLTLGFALVADPLRGIVALTFVTASLLIIVGFSRILFAFAPQARAARLPFMIAGVISLALGALIFANFPEASAITLGILLAVELISNGVSLIIYAFARRSGIASQKLEAANVRPGVSPSTENVTKYPSPKVPYSPTPQMVSNQHTGKDLLKGQRNE